MAGRPPDSAPKAQASIDVGELIDAYGDRLLRSAYLLCGDETEAQDLVQETFLQALRSNSPFRGDSAVYTWLHGILRNLCFRHLRKQKRLLVEGEIRSDETIPPYLAADLDHAACSDQLTQALQKLSPEQREVILLRYYENLKIGEISERTNVSPGTVKSRLHYAVRTLERLLPNELNLFTAEETYR